MTGGSIATVAATWWQAPAATGMVDATVAIVARAVAGQAFVR